MGVRQRTGGPSAGSFSTIRVSRHTASRCGPSHCGQSSAKTIADGASAPVSAAKSSKDFGCTARNVVQALTNPQRQTVIVNAIDTSFRILIPLFILKKEPLKLLL